MTDSEVFELGNKLYANITRNANNIIKTNDYIEFVRIAINALEKQIPKNPENKKYSFYPHSTLLKSKYGECPVCKSMQVDDEYCANCGQKLDWSDEE